MSLVLSANGEIILAEVVLDKFAGVADPMTARLFTNDYTPTRSTILADLTEMASGNGYAPLSNAGSHTYTPGDPYVQKVNASIIWTFTGVPAVPNAYGWFVLDVNGNYIGAERFPDGPYTISSPGDKITLDWKFRLRDETDISGVNAGYHLVALGEEHYLGCITGYHAPVNSWVFKFYTNNPTITDSSVLSDFTLCSDTAFKFSYTDPSAVTTSGTDRSISALAEQFATSMTFVGTIYGVLSLADGGATLLHAWALPSPITITAIGQRLKLTPVWTLRRGSF